MLTNLILSVFHSFNCFVLQPLVAPVDEYGALIYAGRWGIHGVTLPGRATFAPGNVGFATFGAPRPMDVCAHLAVLVPSPLSSLWARLSSLL